MSVSKILAHRSLWYILQNYKNVIEMTSNMIYNVPLGVGLKCLRKIHLNTQCPPPWLEYDLPNIGVASGPSGSPVLASLVKYV